MPASSVPLAAIRQPAFLYDAGGRVVEANDPIESLAGRPLAGCSIADVEAVFGMRLPGGAPYPLAELPVSRALRGEEAVDVPLAVTASDGRVLHVLATASPIRDGDRVAGALVIWQDISDLRRTEEDLVEYAGLLRASEEEARRRGEEIEAIYDGAPIGLCVLDTDLRFIRLNRRFAEINGVSVEEHLGRTPREVVPNLGDQAEAAMRTVLETGEPLIDLEVSGITPARPGEVRYWKERWVPIRDGAGAITGISIAAIEVTEQRRVEEALRESEEKYRTLADLSPDAIVVHTGGIIRYANPAAVRLLRAGAAADLIGTSILDLVHPEDRGKGSSRIDEVQGRGRTTPLWEFRFLIGDVPVDAEATAGPVAWEGRPAVLGVMREIAERKRAEATLHESERRYRELVDSANSAIIRWRADGTVTFANTYAETLFGYGPGELIGKNVSVLVPEQDSTGADLTALAREIVAQPERRATNINENARRDGSRLWMLWTNRAILDERGEVTEVLAIGTDITEQRRAEAALHESQLHLARAQAIAHVGSWSWDVADDTLFWSDEVYRIFGLEPEEIATPRNEDFLAFVHPDDRERVGAAIQDALVDGTYNVEFRVVRRDGSEGYAHSQAAVTFAGGAPVRMEGTVQEITERKRAEVALGETRDYLDSLINYANAPIIVWDPDLRITRFNAAFEHLSGHAADEVIGRHLAILFPEESRGASLVKIQRSITEQWQSVEIPILRPDGGIRIALWNSANIYDQSGATLLATIAQGQDITERKEAAEALRESEAKYRNLVELSPDAILIHQDGRIVLANLAAATLVGAGRPEDLLGRPILEIIHPGARKPVEVNIELDLRGEESPGTTLDLLRDDGTTVAVQGRGARIPFGGRPAVQVVLRDVTEEKQAEEALRGYAENLRRSNEDLERFAYVSSHDLQEPLRAIVSFSQLLERRYKGQLGQDADEYIDFIVEGGIRMQSLIQDLLAYSRVNTTMQDLRPTDMEDVLAAVERGLDLQLREAGAMLTHDPMPVVLADPLQLEQVFTNLVSNAIKFRRPDEPLRIHVGARRTDGFWEFSVSDNGIGIEAEYLDRIFVIFQRLHTKDAYPGTGIGLAIVKRIVDRHGGRVWVESTPGEGSTFLFSLPAA